MNADSLAFQSETLGRGRGGRPGKVDQKKMAHKSTGVMTVLTRSSLAADLRELGLTAGDAVMVHAAFSRVGRVVGGPDAFVDALLEVIGPDGTLLSYQDWEFSVDVWDDDGRVLESLRDHVPPFDPATARPSRDHGIIAATIGHEAGSAPQRQSRCLGRGYRCSG